MAGERAVDAEAASASPSLSSFILGSLCQAESDTSHVDPLEGLVDGLFASRVSSCGSLRRQHAAHPGPGGGAPDEDLPWTGQYPSRSSGAPCRLEEALEEDMTVTSSGSEPVCADAPNEASDPNPPGQGGCPDEACTATATSSPERGGLRDSGAEEKLDEDHTRLVRALCALHALRPSELSFLLSGWQCDWLLLHDGLCPPNALALMQRMQAKRRPQRRHGAKRLQDCDGCALLLETAPPDDPPAAAAAAAPGMELPGSVAAAHDQLAAYQRAFVELQR